MPLYAWSRNAKKSIFMTEVTMSSDAFSLGKQHSFFSESWNSYVEKYCEVNDLFNDVYDNFTGFIATV